MRNEDFACSLWHRFGPGVENPLIQRYQAPRTIYACTQTSREDVTTGRTNWVGEYVVGRCASIALGSWKMVGYLMGKVMSS